MKFSAYNRYILMLGWSMYLENCTPRRRNEERHPEPSSRRCKEREETRQEPKTRRRVDALKRLSEQERRVDALALRADERRDKLRKASGRGKYPTIRRCLNGETRLEGLQSLHGESIAMQGEPGELKHLSNRRKRKKHRFPE